MKDIRIERKHIGQGKEHLENNQPNHPDADCLVLAVREATGQPVSREGSILTVGGTRYQIDSVTCSILDKYYAEYGAIVLPFKIRLTRSSGTGTVSYIYKNVYELIHAFGGNTYGEMWTWR